MKLARSPAPGSTTTVAPRSIRPTTVAGVAATRVSRSPGLPGHTDAHRRAPLLSRPPRAPSPATTPCGPSGRSSERAVDGDPNLTSVEHSRGGPVSHRDDRHRTVEGARLQADRVPGARSVLDRCRGRRHARPRARRARAADSTTSARRPRTASPCAESCSPSHEGLPRRPGRGHGAPARRPHPRAQGRRRQPHGLPRPPEEDRRRRTPRAGRALAGARRVARLPRRPRGDDAAHGPALRRGAVARRGEGPLPGTPRPLTGPGIRTRVHDVVPIMRDPVLSVLDLSPVPSGTRDLGGAARDRRAGQHRRARRLPADVARRAPRHPERRELQPRDPDRRPSRRRRARCASGSGGIMLPNHSPLKVAETFRALAGLHPGPHRPRHRPRPGHRPAHRDRAAPEPRGPHRRRLPRAVRRAPRLRRRLPRGPPLRRDRRHARRRAAAAGVDPRLELLRRAGRGRLRHRLRLRRALRRRRPRPRRPASTASSSARATPRAPRIRTSSSPPR